MPEPVRRGPGRPKLYHGPREGAPTLNLRLPPDLMEWVRAQGGGAYLRRLAEEDRARQGSQT